MVILQFFTVYVLVNLNGFMDFFALFSKLHIYKRYKNSKDKKSIRANEEFYEKRVSFDGRLMDMPVYDYLIGI